MRDTFSSGRSRSTRNCACSLRNWSTQSPHTYNGGGLSPHCTASAGSKHICVSNYRVTIIKFPSCLYGINTRQWKLFLWTTRLNSPSYPHDCTIFFIQLKNVYNEFKLKQGGAIWSSIATWCHTEVSTFSFSIKPFEMNIERKVLGCWTLLSRAIVPAV